MNKTDTPLGLLTKEEKKEKCNSKDLGWRVVPGSGSKCAEPQ